MTQFKSMRTVLLAACSILFLGGCSENDCEWVEKVDQADFESRLALAPQDLKMQIIAELMQANVGSLLPQNLEGSASYDERALAICKQNRRAIEKAYSY